VEQAAREALRLDPEDFVALNNLAVALRHQRRNREAAQVYEQAARIALTQRTIRRTVVNLRHTRAASHLSDRTRSLIADDARARRYNAKRWDWERAGRRRPFGGSLAVSDRPTPSRSAWCCSCSRSASRWARGLTPWNGPSSWASRCCSARTGHGSGGASVTPLARHGPQPARKIGDRTSPPPESTEQLAGDSSA
jgi:hypothetical protein